MTNLPTLDPEITDLGLAIGLLTLSGSGVELNSGWFADPGTQLTAVLADDNRRGALIRFADAVLADGNHSEQDGVVLLPVVNLRELSGDSTLPDVVVLGIARRRARQLHRGRPRRGAHNYQSGQHDPGGDPALPGGQDRQDGAQTFALLDGGVVKLAAELTLQTATPPVDDFGLAGVSATVETALAAGSPPSFTLALKGLHLPGAAALSDVQIGGPGVSVQDSLLSLVLGLVRQSADLPAGGCRHAGQGHARPARARQRGRYPAAARRRPARPRRRSPAVLVRRAHGTPDRTRGVAGLAQHALGGTPVTEELTTAHVDIPIGSGPVTPGSA